VLRSERWWSVKNFPNGTVARKREKVIRTGKVEGVKKSKTERRQTVGPSLKERGERGNEIRDVRNPHRGGRGDGGNRLESLILIEPLQLGK